MVSQKGLQNVIEDISVWFSTLVLTLLQIVLLPYNLLVAAFTAE